MFDESNWIRSGVGCHNLRRREANTRLHGRVLILKDAVSISEFVPVERHRRNCRPAREASSPVAEGESFSSSVSGTLPVSRNGPRSRPLRSDERNYHRSTCGRVLRSSPDGQLRPDDGTNSDELPRDRHTDFPSRTRASSVLDRSPTSGTLCFSINISFGSTTNRIIRSQAIVLYRPLANPIVLNLAHILGRQVR